MNINQKLKAALTSIHNDDDLFNEILEVINAQKLTAVAEATQESNSRITNLVQENKKLKSLVDVMALNLKELNSDDLAAANNFAQGSAQKISKLEDDLELKTRLLSVMHDAYNIMIDQHLDY